MSHVHASETQTGDGSIVIHRSRMYDLSFGWAIRRSDGAILRWAGVGAGDRVLDIGRGGRRQQRAGLAHLTVEVHTR
jgi:hypothetical protein